MNDERYETSVMAGRRSWAAASTPERVAAVHGDAASHQVEVRLGRAKRRRGVRRVEDGLREAVQEGTGHRPKPYELLDHEPGVLAEVSSAVAKWVMSPTTVEPGVGARLREGRDGVRAGTETPPSAVELEMDPPDPRLGRCRGPLGVQTAISHPVAAARRTLAADERAPEEQRSVEACGAQAPRLRQGCCEPEPGGAAASAARATGITPWPYAFALTTATSSARPAVRARTSTLWRIAPRSMRAALRSAVNVSGSPPGAGR